MLNVIKLLYSSHFSTSYIFNALCSCLIYVYISIFCLAELFCSTRHISFCSCRYITVIFEKMFSCVSFTVVYRFEFTFDICCNREESAYSQSVDLSHSVCVIEMAIYFYQSYFFLLAKRMWVDMKIFAMFLYTKVKLH